MMETSDHKYTYMRWYHNAPMLTIHFQRNAQMPSTIVEQKIVWQFFTKDIVKKIVVCRLCSQPFSSTRILLFMQIFAYLIVKVSVCRFFLVVSPHSIILCVQCIHKLQTFNFSIRFTKYSTAFCN